MDDYDGEEYLRNEPKKEEQEESEQEKKYCVKSIDFKMDRIIRLLEKLIKAIKK